MDSDYVPPPPAYSEQEFDRKISQATTLSLATPVPNVDADGWQRYDPYVFQNTPTLTSGATTSNTLNGSASFSPSRNTVSLFNDKSSSQSDQSSVRCLPSVVPLRIEKKTQSQYSSNVNRTFLDSSPHSCHPPSKSIASSTSKDPFPPNVLCEEIPAQKFTNVPAHPTHSSSYERTSYTSSVVCGHPQAHSVNDEDAFDPYREFQIPQPHPPARQSLPSIPRPHSAVPHPSSHTRSRSEAVNSPSTPRVQFDPLVAYGKANLTPITAIQAIHSSLPSPIRSDVQYDAYSFYNSSVSSKMAPIRPSQADIQYHESSYEQANRQVPNAHQFHQSQPPSWQSPSRPTSRYHNVPSTPRSVASSNSIRFSQYSTGSSRDSVLSTQSDPYHLQ
ncbi:hypothetical protein JR316_0004751 [Psilocybe cubensis]|uniref:Uncharacterized protein n=2 Tax=Psilocybe cubensis TaxID=181762 RepID=A0A8H7XYN7_PSICU|nr:hypothetical protein JR316_0004751 [Psilocybe cubensis]KAH9482651.1 hypothetical protein JR316_0004751 [Psilocybe cubensis]